MSSTEASTDSLRVFLSTAYRICINNICEIQFLMVLQRINRLRKAQAKELPLRRVQAKGRQLTNRPRKVQAKQILRRRLRQLQCRANTSSPLIIFL